jgi:hypothetical protein
MKSLRYLFATVFFLFSLAAQAGGSDVGRGGDSIALDFRAIALYNLKLIQKRSDLFPGFDTARFGNLVANTKIETLDRVFLDGVEKDAVNFSNPERIEVGAIRWLRLPMNDPRKEALVFHEYLGLMGLEDSDDHSYSLKLLSLLRTYIKNDAGTPLYNCFLIKDPKMEPRYLDSVRVGGTGESDIGHLGAERIRVQIYLGSGGAGTDFLLTLADGAKQIGMLELPRLGIFPPTVDIYALDRSETLWQVHCVR